jgi:hypothetical protein
MLRKRKVNKIIEESFWEGFQAGLSNGIYLLSYSEYRYCEVHKIAAAAGRELARSLLREHVERIAARERGEPRKLSTGFRYKIPASVYAECYGAARLP